MLKPQSNFNTGIVSPRLEGQGGLENFHSGLSECHNAITVKEGVIVRRPGTEFIAFTKYNRPVKLLRFENSATESYAIEVGCDETPGTAYFRFFKHGQPVMDGGVPYEVTTYQDKANATQNLWYEDEDLPLIRANAQSFDVLYLFRSRGLPLKLLRFGDTDWKCHEVNFVGEPSEWSSGGANYPSCGTYFQQRLSMGGCPEKPQTIYATWSSVYDTGSSDGRGGQAYRESLTTDIDDGSKGWSFTMYVSQYSLIRFLEQAGHDLFVGTASGEFTMVGERNSAITGTANEGENPPSFLKNTKYGSAAIEPVSIGETIIAAQRAGKRLREYRYSYEAQKHKGMDLYRLAEHLTVDGEIKAMAWQQEPESILWVVKSDGRGQALVYVPEENVYAWSTFSTGYDNGGSFDDVLTIPGSSSEGAFATQDEVWFSVKRPVNGVYRYLIERLTEFKRADTVNPPVISPAYGSFDMPVTVTITEGSVAGDIYYTLDGTVPSGESGFLYSVPFQIGNPTIIKAIDIEGNLAVSVIDANYTDVIDADERALLTSENEAIQVF